MRIALLVLALLAIWVAPASAANVTVSGTAVETLGNAVGADWTGCNGSTNNVRLVLDANAFQQTVPCNATTGAFSFSNVPLSGTHLITIYLVGSGTEQGVLYTRNANTTSAISGLLITEDFIRLRGVTSAITNATINTWDNSNDTAIPAASTGVALTTTATQRIGVFVEAGQTFQPGGNVTVTKAIIEGTWTSGAEVLEVTGTGDDDCDDTDSLNAMDPFCRRTAGTFNAGTGTVRLTLAQGTAHTDVNGPLTFNNYQVHPAVAGQDLCFVDNGTITVATAELGNGTAVSASIWGRLDAVNGAGTVTIASGATLDGSGAIEARGNVTGGGTVTSNIDLFMRPNGGTVLLGSTSGSANWQFFDIVARTTGAAATVRAAAGGTGAFVAQDDVIVGDPSDAATTTLDLDTNDRRVDTGWLIGTQRGHVELSSSQPTNASQDVIVRLSLDSNGGPVTAGVDFDVDTGATATMLASTVNVGDDFWIATGGSYTVTGAGTLNVGAEFIKSGSFTPGTGTVSFIDPTKVSVIWHSSPTTFHNLRNATGDKVLRVDLDYPVTVTNTFTLTGASCTSRASLASSYDGSPFQLAAASVVANFADIGDSNQTSGSRTATNSWNHGGNTNWTFSTPCAGNTVSGVALQSEGGAGWSQCNGVTPNVTVSVNGFSPVSVPCTAGTGAFTATTAIEPDVPVAAFLDPSSAGDRGATYTRAATPVANLTGLTVVLGQTRIRSETPTAVTNADINRYDDRYNTDVPSSVDENTGAAVFPATVEVVVEAGDTYAPMSDTTARAVDIAGTLGSVGNAGDDFTVTGTGTNASCTAALGTSVPTCIRPGGAISMQPADEYVYSGTGAVHVAAASYPKLELVPTSGSHTYQLGTSAIENTITTTGYLRIGSGTTVSTTSFSPNITVGDDFDSSGMLSGSGTGTITVMDDLDGAGDYDLTAGTLRFLGQSFSDSAFCETAGGAYSFWDLEIANAHTSTRTVTGAGACPVLVRNDLRVGRTSDTNLSGLDLDPGDTPLEVDGDVLVTTRGSLGASSAAPMRIAGDFSNDGTFTANGGTVEFDTAGTISSITHSAATSFANLRVLVQPKELRFPAGRTTSVTGTLTLTGTSCAAPVNVRSTVPGTQYTLAIGTVTPSYVTLRDAVAAPAQTVPLTGDLGNNSGWTFSGGCTPAPGSLFVDDSNASSGSTNATVGSDTFHMSWSNAGTMAFDEQQARLVSSPLDDVVALWQFDTATGQTADSSGNGRTLTANGTPTSPAGQAGFAQALGLNGSTQFATAPTDVAYDLGNDFTVEAWFRRSGSPATDEAIIERGNGTDRTFLLYVEGGGTRVSAIVSRNGVDRYVGGGSVNVTDGAWHHVALTVDAANNQRIYVDGVQQGAPFALGGPVNGGSGDQVAIGRYGNSSAGFFNGQIDDVRISDVARTAPELLGAVKLRTAHNTVLWTSAAQPVTCAPATRCADVTYSGPALTRPGARYYAQGRGRLQPWAAYTAWSTADWFETSALLSISVPSGNLAFGSTMPGTNVTGTRDVQVTSTLSAGYRLYVSDASDTAGMTGAGTLPDWTAAWDDPQPWPQATHGYFGVTLLTGPGKDTVEWGTATLADDWTNAKYVGVRNTTPSLLVNRGGPTGATDTFKVGVRAAPSAAQAAGSYSTTLTFTVLANP